MSLAQQPTPQIDTSRIPEWIWADSQSKPPNGNQSLTFQRELEVEDRPRIATLRIAADFCYAWVNVNGTTLCGLEPYAETLEFDITNAMVAGKNTIRIEARSIPGPHAIAASINVGIRDQPSQTVLVTDMHWDCLLPDASTKTSAQSHGRVSEALWGIGRRSIRLDPTENYEQWRQAVSGSRIDERQYWTPPGFSVTHLRSALPEEGSWVSLAIDDKGRLTIAREDKGLLRLTLDENRKAVQSVDVVDETLLECRGLVYAHNSLFANANNAKALMRLRDGDGDGRFEDSQKMREFPGGVGHGRNDLAVGQDGWIYSIHGDSVDVPTDNIRDRTSPLRDRAPLSLPKPDSTHPVKAKSQRLGQGHVLRTNASGSSWELVCSGLRNPYGISQNKWGDWFTYDADAEFDMGTPWYRPTRVVQILSGADYGWRAVTGKWPPYFPDHPDNAMPTLDIGKGSPTAVQFAYGSHFPVDYKQALMILDWTYGRVLAVHLFPRGAGYRASSETFLQGRPLNVTDIAFGPEGTMYLITGGRKTQSSLVRVDYVGPAIPEGSISTHEQRCLSHAMSVRSTRERLETMHIDGTTFDEALVWEHLDSSDWQLRHAARIALEHQPLDVWRTWATTERRTQAAIECCLALTRCNQQDLAKTIIDRLLRCDVMQLDLCQTMGLLQSYTQMSISEVETQQSSNGAIIAQLRAISKRLADQRIYNRCGSSQTAQGSCLRLLSMLDPAFALEQTFKTLMTRSEQERKLDGLFSIRNAASGWNDERRREYFLGLNAAQSFVKGEGMEKFLRQIRDDAVGTMAPNERERLADAIAPQRELEPVSSIAPRLAVRQWSFEELSKAISSTRHEPSRERGKVIFAEAQCNRCHRIGAEGQAIGPDLTHVGRRFNQLDLVTSIVDPSRVIAENYRNARVFTKDGATHVGRLLVEGDYRSERVSIATDPYSMKGNIEIPKGDIQSFEESKLSPMPTGLLDGFNEAEILDLLAYLNSPDQ
jgi:putative heme-binding domain-containing protein